MAKPGQLEVKELLASELGGIRSIHVPKSAKLDGITAWSREWAGGNVGKSELRPIAQATIRWIERARRRYVLGPHGGLISKLWGSWAPVPRRIFAGGCVAGGERLLAGPAE